MCNQAANLQKIFDIAIQITVFFAYKFHTKAYCLKIIFGEKFLIFGEKYKIFGQKS